MSRRKAPKKVERHELALRLARECRYIIQACLQQEEWGDADQEFYAIIFEGLTHVANGKLAQNRQVSGKLPANSHE